MIQDDIDNMLFQAQNMFKLNKGMSPMIFMRNENENENEEGLIIESIDMSSLDSTCDAIKKLKSMIENGSLKEYVFMKEIYIPEKDWILMIIKANVNEEKQWICDVYLEDEEFKFSEWTCYNSTNMKAKINTFNNLFGQVFCNYN